MPTFAPLKNDRLLRAAKGEPVDRVPVWAMRQAGRYLPEYRAFMQDKDFFTVCRTPEYACEVTLQPIRRMPLDAAIIFSDILVIPQALGMTVEMQPKVGPVFPRPMRQVSDWQRVCQDVAAASAESSGEQPPAVDSADGVGKPLLDYLERNAGFIASRLQYVYDAITLTRLKLDGKVPLIGFCGSPWTLMVYMIEGQSSRLFAECKRWLYRHSQASHEVLSLLATVCGEYLCKQIEAGAQLVQIFDSHAGVLSQPHFREFSLPYIRQVVSAVKAKHPDVPVTVFCKDAHHAVPDITTSGCDVASLDWTLDLGACHAELSAHGVSAQGNLDPGVLYASVSEVKAHVRRMLDALPAAPGGVPQRYIANLGHGMNPDHDPDALAAFVDAVHEYSRTFA